MSIEQRGRGKWLVTIFIDRVNGKLIRRKYTVLGQRKDAERFERERLAERDADRLPLDRLTKITDLATRYLASAQLSPTTAARYRSLLEHHVVPYIGKSKVEEIRPHHIESLYDTLLKNGHRTKARGLSPQTVKHIHVLLKILFRAARRWRATADNIMVDVLPPKVAKAHRKIIPSERVADFLDAATRSKYEIPILLAIAAGLRRGEILGLRWSDVDFDAQTLTVLQTVVEPEGGALIVKPPKSDESRRTISVSQAVIVRLKAHKAAQAKLMLEMGTGYRRDLDLVCAQTDGGYIRPSRFTTAYRGLASLHGLQGVGLHDLRHSHATMLLEAGVDLKVVSSRLGHSTITLTANTYAHVTRKLDRDAADRLDDLFSKSKN